MIAPAFLRKLGEAGVALAFLALAFLTVLTVLEFTFGTPDDMDALIRSWTWR